MAPSGVDRSWTDSSTSTRRQPKPLVSHHGHVLEPNRARRAGGACGGFSGGRVEQALSGEAFQQLGQRQGVGLVEVVARRQDDAHDRERPGFVEELGGAG